MTEFKSGVDLSLMEGVLRQYQDDDTSLIMILQQAQSIYGYLPQEVIYHVAERTGNYGQMLRNARVHDSDGLLTDHENAASGRTA